MQMNFGRDDMIGAWTLEGTFVEDADGKRTPTWGDNPKGIIIYTADGHMTAITRRGDRTLPASGSSADDKAAAFDTYLNYAGRWSLAGNVVTHHIQHALDPNWVGSDRDRTIDFQGDRMVFSGLAGDGKTNAIIIWRRAQ
jgi:hypothetical protein